MSCKPSRNDVAARRLRIRVESLSGTADAHGHIDATADANWSLHADGWAECISKGGREFWRQNAVDGTIDRVWRCNYSAALATADHNMRLVCNGTVHNVVYVDHVDLDREQVVIQTRKAG